MGESAGLHSRRVAAGAGVARGGLSGAAPRHPQGPADFPEQYCGVEWGWRKAGDATAKSHQLLSDAEKHLGSRALRARWRTRTISR